MAKIKKITVSSDVNVNGDLLVRGEPLADLVREHYMDEAYLTWGGKNIKGDVTPIDMAASAAHSANRFAFANPDGIIIEYSHDGETFKPYETTDRDKIDLVSGVRHSHSYFVGARSTGNTSTDKLRITFNAKDMGIYIKALKLLINVSTDFGSGSHVIIENSTIGAEETFTAIGTYDLSGWPGWNSIPLPNTTFGQTSYGQSVAAYRLTFGISKDAPDHTLRVSDIVLLGACAWATPSELARTGHVYSYDADQNVTFPAEVYANNLKISGTVTKAIGGIAKDKQYADANLVDVLSDLLFPYVAPTGFSISTTASAGTFEYGTTKTVTKVTPSFIKGSKNITSINIGTTSGGSDLYSGTSATSGTAITLKTSKTYDGSTGGTIYCTMSDGDTSVSANASVRYEYYTYYAVTDTTDTPTSWTAVGNSSVSGISIKSNAGQYIWIASTQNFDVSEKSDPKNQYGICQLNELSGKYNNAANTIKREAQTLTNAKNYKCKNKYYFYRLAASRAASGDSKFKLGKGDS